MNRLSGSPLLLLLMLAGLTAMTPFSIDAYLPAMPSIARGLGTTIHNVELSISIFLAGYSLGQLLGGPFSDHFGRRRGMFTGLSLFLLGSGGLALSTSIEAFWVFRIIQAVGGGIAVVNPGAIIRDLSEGKQSARYFSHMALIMLVAPLLAPLIGVGILKLAGWRGIFVFLFTYAVLIFLAIYLRVPETRVALGVATGTLQRYLMVFRHRIALGYLFTSSFATGGMFAFITSSPSVYMGFFGVGETVYSILFGANVAALVVINRLNVVLIKHYPLEGLIYLGQGIQIVSGLTLFLYVLNNPEPVLAVTVALIMVFLSSQAFIIANANASAIEFFPANSGTASALLGSCSFATGAMTGSLVALLTDGTPVAMIGVMLACAICGPALRFLCQRGGDAEQK